MGLNLDVNLVEQTVGLGLSGNYEELEEGDNRALNNKLQIDRMFYFEIKYQDLGSR